MSEKEHEAASLPEVDAAVEDLVLEDGLDEFEVDEKPPVLTIHIQSWSTPIIGLLMLVFGLIGGYVGRPLLNPESPQVVQTTGNQGAAVQPDSEKGGAPVATIPAPTPDPSVAAQRAELMSVVMEKVRHFRGNPDAPVVLVEFSDFQ